ncbi:hypothetical protein C5C36_14035 [Rathayibacter sp. AY1G1]|uniref:hypothetical protein n=1 Tax=Rathayibacter sp. AY1G1 TaxID=2080564 RepID=UPI000CE906E9|nr:hypothetical protein [Rathayibacter sp. AY1G1]PPH10485.1 hypothetical protein C5C36_14035 [Rathayibacter sp. AY1G1]
MADEIEVISDGEGVVVTGNFSAVERFLRETALLRYARKLSLGKLSGLLSTGADFASSASGIAEQSAMYLKLTPESVKRLKDAGGLMKTKTGGISHVMLGETGKDSLKWLQVQDGPTSLLTNPAVLSGVGSLMSQFAQQAEAQELRAMLVRIDEKLDDIRRRQRDEVLARLKSSGAAIEEASIIRARGGDPRTLWDKVSGTHETILNVQEDGLAALSALADKVKNKRETGELKKVMREIEHEVAIQLAALGRCFELQDEFGIIELDHVLATAPLALEGHRQGISHAREKRRVEVLEKTAQLMAQMDAAGGIANENILLHAIAARSVIDSLNATAAAIDDFHSPLGIDSDREALRATAWRQALRVPGQRKTAGKELGKKALVGAGLAALSLGALATKSKFKPSA